MAEDTVDDAKIPTAEEIEARAKARAYSRAYYEKRKVQIAAQKRARYQNDPEVREKMKAAVRRHRAREKRKKAAKATQAETKHVPKLLRVEAPDGTRYRLRMYTPLQAAFHVGVSKKKLLYWEQKGYMPPAMYQGSRGRLYTEDQVAVIRELNDEYTNPETGFINDASGFSEALNAALAALKNGVRDGREPIEDDGA